MKELLVCSTLIVAIAANTCDDCTAIVTVLVGGLCPTAEDVAECEAGLPAFWKAIALGLWPGYYDPSGEWMCAPLCAAPEEVEMTCDACTMGIQASIDQLLSPEAMDAIVTEFIN